MDKSNAKKAVCKRATAFFGARQIVYAIVNLYLDLLLFKQLKGMKKERNPFF
ncbi:MAG: hypothetical protein LAT67_07880 [Balneolales bacterium]|nr:hypothetical protein [Balneolales bacterium]